MTEIEQFIADWINGQCRKFRAELNEDRSEEEWGPQPGEDDA